jgi:Major Facilitator Superfamily
MVQVLRNRNLALLWSGQCVSIAGDWLLIIALPIYVYQRTGSAFAAGIATIAGTLPDLLFGSVAGVLVDRWNHKHVLIAADLLRAFALPLLLLVDGANTIWVVYVFAALMSTLSVPFGPARAAFIPRLVAHEDLLAANALDSLGETVAGLVGPALGGIVFGLMHLPGVVLLDAGSFLVSCILIGCVRSPAAYASPSGERHRPTVAFALARFWQEWRCGLKQLARDRLLGVVAAARGVAMLGQGLISVLWVVYVTDILAGGAVVYGGVQVAVALGTLIGGLLIGTFGKLAAPRYLIGASGMLVGLLLLAVFQLASVPAILALNLLAGIPAVGFFVSIHTLVQQRAAADVRGRVFGLLGTSSAFCLLVGMGTASLLGGVVRVDRLLSGAAVLYFLAGSLFIGFGASAGHARAE